MEAAMQKPKTCIMLLWTAALAGWLVASCDHLDMTPTPGLGGIEIATPTPTPGGVPAVPATQTAEPTPSMPSAGEVELRFIDPGSQQECVAHFPFEIATDLHPPTISGGGRIDCVFAVQQCGEGVCVTYNSSYDYEGVLSGVIQPPTESYPQGALDTTLAGTLTMKQYWTDIPPETIMLFTEDSPFEVTGSDIIPLFFHFQEGAVVEVANESMPDALPWVFTLHLQ
jgi:hypothetical protein